MGNWPRAARHQSHPTWPPSTYPMTVITAYTPALPRLVLFVVPAAVALWPSLPPSPQHPQTKGFGCRISNGMNTNYMMRGQMPPASHTLKLVTSRTVAGFDGPMQFWRNLPFPKASAPIDNVNVPGSPWSCPQPMLFQSGFVCVCVPQLSMKSCTGFTDHLIIWIKTSFVVSLLGDRQTPQSN